MMLATLSLMAPAFVLEEAKEKTSLEKSVFFIAKIAFATHKARHGFSPPPSAQKVLSTLCLQEILNKNVLYEILWSKRLDCCTFVIELLLM